VTFTPAGPEIGDHAVGVVRGNDRPYPPVRVNDERGFLARPVWVEIEPVHMEVSVLPSAWVS